MTKIITSENRIIFDGHARTKEECETISLACEELAKSDKFRTVKYGSGYAEFEKVGKTSELKFIGAPAILKMVFDSHITKVTGLGKEWTTSGTEITAALPNSYDGEAFIFSVVFQDGYIIDSIFTTADIGSKNNDSFTLIADSGGLDATVTITSKLASAQTFLFKHRYKNNSLIGTGNYKFRHYSVNKPATTETWIINESFDESDKSADVKVKFTSGGTKFGQITIGGPSTKYYGLIYCYQTEENGIWKTFFPLRNGWTIEKYRTVTFDNPVTDSTLLAWLNNNAVKQ